MATAKQIAARKLFAERARAGTLKKKRAKNPVKPKSITGEVISVYKTPSGKNALTIKSRDYNTFSYIGEFGSGSGHKYETMKKIVQDMLKYAPKTKLASGEDFVNLVKPIQKNPIAKKSLTARQYVTRPSQATKKPPSARLTTRRTKALKAPAGYFPNPILGFPFCVSAKAEGMNDFYKIAYFRDSETAVLFAKAYANLHQYLSIKVEAD